MHSLRKATSAGIKISGFSDEILMKGRRNVLSFRPRKIDLTVRFWCKFKSITK